MSGEGTWRDLARKYYPNATDDECDRLLWETTCFPMGGAELVEKQLTDHVANTDGTVAAAVDRSYRILDEAMAEIRAREDASA